MIEKSTRKNVIYRIQMHEMRLRAKPKCPCCNNSLTFIYDDVSEGHINQKCHRCGRQVMIDLKTMETFLVIEDLNAANM